MNSECTHIRRLISYYIDGDLEPAKMAAVSEHLLACRECSREHDALRSVISGLHSFRQVKAPADFLEGIHERINEDSIIHRIREALSLMRFRIPAELAAFAATAMLILLIFNFLPSGEKAFIKRPGYEQTKIAADHSVLPAQTAENNKPKKQTSGSGVAPQIEQQEIPVRLALSLKTRQETVAIPSRSVSYGNPISGDISNSQYLRQTENGDVTREIVITPDEVNLKIDEIINYIEGNVISRVNNIENGYPSSLTLSVPYANYQHFISRLDALGALKDPVPALPEASGDATILIQMELYTRE
ncbi:MAG: zf-HC2 domain-containing protein [Deltaproteobacteria bacterium]|nr:zf-HC2 domain-containing protein [Deltaproteobacteria bacterium]